MIEKVKEELQAIVESDDSDENKEYKIKKILNIE
jgi:hypothetical protein